METEFISLHTGDGGIFIGPKSRTIQVNLCLRRKKGGLSFENENIWNSTEKNLGMLTLDGVSMC